MTPRPDIDLVVFDILGTMVDEPGGIRRAIRSSLPDADDAAAADRWLLHVDVQQQDILAGRRPFAASTVIDGEAAALVAADVAGELATAARRLEPWPDSVAALDRIAARFPVVGLSNASAAALTRISAHAGLRWHQLLSAEQARTYKPAAEVYRLAIDNAGCPPERLLMVAAHAWDLRGAQAAGMRTAYVERPVGDPPAPEDAFDLTATGLDDLATQLGC
ncbi:haloacid dehalogenase type II [Jiangella endophytica]|uniref:haloacid dehalogenase type II n=1 Tax=Jiangella endophytica TaxID=1623398 RepID=UPI000E34F599|nr:haloacid dehalogenase type II [Jiangella endophytica]